MTSIQQSAAVREITRIRKQRRDFQSELKAMSGDAAVAMLADAVWTQQEFIVTMRIETLLGLYPRDAEHFAQRVLERCAVPVDVRVGKLDVGDRRRLCQAIWPAFDIAVYQYVPPEDNDDDLFYEEMAQAA